MLNYSMKLKELLDVLHKIVLIMNSNKIEYQLSGSLAGKFYGLIRTSNDIDFALPIKHCNDIKNLFAKYVIKEFYRCKDDFFDLDQIKCNIDGVQVEFGFNEDGFYHSHTTCKKIPLAYFWDPTIMSFRDIEIAVQSIDKLLEYKSQNRHPFKAINQMEDAQELSKILETGSWRDFQIEPT